MSSEYLRRQRAALAALGAPEFDAAAALREFQARQEGVQRMALAEEEEKRSKAEEVRRQAEEARRQARERREAEQFMVEQERRLYDNRRLPVEDSLSDQVRKQRIAETARERAIADADRAAAAGAEEIRALVNSGADPAAVRARMRELAKEIAAQPWGSDSEKDIYESLAQKSGISVAERRIALQSELEQERNERRSGSQLFREESQTNKALVREMNSLVTDAAQLSSIEDREFRSNLTRAMSAATNNQRALRLLASGRSEDGRPLSDMEKSALINSLQGHVRDNLVPAADGSGTYLPKPGTYDRELADLRPRTDAARRILERARQIARDLEASNARLAKYRALEEQRAGLTAPPAPAPTTAPAPAEPPPENFVPGDGRLPAEISREDTSKSRPLEMVPSQPRKAKPPPRKKRKPSEIPASATVRRANQSPRLRELPLEQWVEALNRFHPGEGWRLGKSRKFFVNKDGETIPVEYQ